MLQYCYYLMQYCYLSKGSESILHHWNQSGNFIVFPLLTLPSIPVCLRYGVNNKVGVNDKNKTPPFSSAQPNMSSH